MLLFLLRGYNTFGFVTGDSGCGQISHGEYLHMLPFRLSETGGIIAQRIGKCYSIQERIVL